jgi:PncC family amidohydrolase
MTGQPLEVLAGKLLCQRRWRLAVAESCTGGLVGHRLTNVPGSSDYYAGGIIAYANEVKASLLGVRWETLEQYGAVSRETVLEMARGVRKALAVEIGMSVSGIAGPGGGTPEKPVGLTWIGLSMEGYENAWRYLWEGDRTSNKERSAQALLDQLVNCLQTLPPPAGLER